MRNTCNIQNIVKKRLMIATFYYLNRLIQN